MDNLNRTTKRNFGLVAALLIVGATGNVAADDGARISTSSQGLASDRAAISATAPSRDEYEALTLSGDRSKKTRESSQQKSADSVASTPNTDFWFYSADVELFGDRDRDGYFTEISLLFDADTYYDVADVYAVIYLSYEYGPWNEYAETETFTIFGSAGADDYVVETDLVQGYPTGNYDISIDLYDTYDNALVATIGPEDTSELSILPLEDIGRDTPDVTTQIVVSSGGGGSLSWLLLLGLAGVLARRR